MKQIEQEDLGQIVYRNIREFIVTKQLKPGERIGQEAISKQLGVSRTPLLKALQMLERELLVEFRQRRGYFVKEYSLEEMFELYELREVIEGLAARRAAKSIDPLQIDKLRSLFTPFVDSQTIDAAAYELADQHFHSMILEVGSSSLISRFDTIKNMSIIAYQMGLHVSPIDTLNDHLEIIDALAKHDGELAENLMRNHLKKGKGTLEEKLNSENEASIPARG